MSRGAVQALSQWLPLLFTVGSDVMRIMHVIQAQWLTVDWPFNMNHMATLEHSDHTNAEAARAILWPEESVKNINQLQSKCLLTFLSHLHINMSKFALRSEKWAHGGFGNHTWINGPFRDMFLKEDNQQDSAQLLTQTVRGTAVKLSQNLQKHTSITLWLTFRSLVFLSTEWIGPLSIILHVSSTPSAAYLRHSPHLPCIIQSCP